MPYKLAIIEDDTPIANMYKMKFELHGFVVSVAENGLVGLELVKTMQPDLVLLDLMMPGMTGDEMLTQMRKEPWGKNIPVIVLTNLSENEALPKVRGQSIDGLLVKAQYTPKQVVTIVQKTLKP